MFSFCIIMMNFSLVESFSKYSSSVKIVLISHKNSKSYEQNAYCIDEKARWADLSTTSTH